MSDGSAGLLVDRDDTGVDKAGGRFWSGSGQGQRVTINNGSVGRDVRITWAG